MEDKVIRCVAVDDEAPGLKVMELYCKKIPFLHLEKIFQNPVEALLYIEEQQPDLVFLDINMPDINGMQFAHILQHSPAIIFTTAHRTYAPESYDVGAVDYLLKPILFDRFMLAVQKVHSRLSQKEPQEKSNTPAKEQVDFMFVKSDSRFFKVNFSDILFIEGMRDYVAIHTKKQKILTLSGIEKILNRLPQGQFMRVHRSFIVALQHIELIQHNHIAINGRDIPISHSYKSDLFKVIGKR